MINAAVIGVSGFGNVHYHDLLRYHQAGRLNFAAAAIINQEQEAEKCEVLRSLGCRIYTDYRQMLEDFSGKLALCMIPTGIGLHREMAVAAMEHGASAFIEKPAAPTMQDIEAIRAAERKTGRFTAVGFQSIYQPDVQRIKREILAGSIGKVHCVKCIGLWPRDRRYYTRNNWAGKLRDGKGWILDSPFNNALAHYLNLPCFFAGSTFEKSAEFDYVDAQLFRCNPEIETTDTAVIHGRTVNGIDVRFYTTHNCESTFGPKLEVRGEKGSIFWDTNNGTVFKYADRSEEVFASDTGNRDCVVEALLKRLDDPKEFVCGMDIAGAHVLMVNGAHESSPIIPVPAKAVEKLMLEDGNYRYIWRGIDDVLKKLNAEERMPSLADFPWACPGEKIPMKNYREFKGGKITAQPLTV